MRAGNASDETGSGTLLIITVIAMAVILGLAVLAVAQFAISRSQASAAADLGALSGAERIAFGDACGTAARVVNRNNAWLERCEVVGGDLVVEVSVKPGPLLSRAAQRAGQAPPRIHAIARAGSPAGRE